MKIIHAISMLVVAAAAGCGNGDASSGAAGTASPSGRATGAPAGTGAAPAQTAAAAVPTTDLTPGKIKDNAAKLLGKQVQGSGVMYTFETGTLNKAVFHYGYIADDEAKTNSFKCVLDADPKLPKNAKVTFEGKWMGGWVDGCKVALQK